MASTLSSVVLVLFTRYWLLFALILTMKDGILNVLVLLFYFQHFGKEIIAKELNVDQDHPDVLRLFLAVYKSFMEVFADYPFPNQILVSFM